VILWAREPEVVADINERHENRAFLPGVTLPNAVSATSDAITIVAAAIHRIHIAAGNAVIKSGPKM
jgi:glycerol-3-phosphate dehydrogenase (NAD(P)+)